MIARSKARTVVAKTIAAKMVAVLAMLAAAGSPAGATMARAPLPATVALDSRAYVERVSTDLNGRARRVLAAANRLAPGDRVVFVVNYRNRGDAPVRGFYVTNPVPARVRLDMMQFSAAPADMQVSVDGGAHWGRLDDFTIPTPLGGTRRATSEDITHVRWGVHAPVAPGDSGRIAWRGVVR
ncbi:hypothetical protein [Sphingobium aquiterrae]|uniref:hypothetical protein n=1 Tax=Sphingobium aquiterrae TaxID=2038656 RepID=UPI003018261A